MSLLTVAKEFVLIPQHTTPSNATKEIDELYDVFVEIRARWKIEVWWWIFFIKSINILRSKNELTFFLSSLQNVIFLGDFNAACGYVAKKNRKNIRLLSDPSFIWLIQDNVDTTVKESTDCAYDRYANKNSNQHNQIMLFMICIWPTFYACSIFYLTFYG